MDHQCIAAAREWLAWAGLAPGSAAALAGTAARLAAAIDTARPCAIGLAGAPGTGKSTLAGAVGAALAARAVPAFTLSLDDYYLGAGERARLARRVHPLFRHRGVPGTHDFATLLADLDALLEGRLDALALPRFDKARDDRAPRNHEPPRRPPTVVFAEGWVVGVPPEAPGAVDEPVNRWEAEHDPDGAWRRAVHGHHRAYHRALTPRLASRTFLAAPGWKAVIRWREEQEARLPRPALADRAAVIAFLNPFERLVRHAQRGFEAWADQVVALDEAHRPVREAHPWPAAEHAAEPAAGERRDG